jgi:hypothetical protein
MRITIVAMLGLVLSAAPGGAEPFLAAQHAPVEER